MLKRCIRTKTMWVNVISTEHSRRSTIFQDIDNATRAAISRVSNIIRVFADHFVPLTDTLLLEAYEWVIEQEGDAKRLLLGDTGDALVAAMSLRC